jgi:hypothetical protein
MPWRYACCPNVGNAEPVPRHHNCVGVFDTHVCHHSDSGRGWIEAKSQTPHRNVGLRGFSVGRTPSRWLVVNPEEVGSLRAIPLGVLQIDRNAPELHRQFLANKEPSRCLTL